MPVSYTHLDPIFSVMPQLLFLDFPIIAMEKLAIAENSDLVFCYRYIRGARQLFIVLPIADAFMPEGFPQ